MGFEVNGNDDFGALVPVLGILVLVIGYLWYAGAINTDTFKKMVGMKVQEKQEIKVEKKVENYTTDTIVE